MTTRRRRVRLVAHLVGPILLGLGIAQAVDHFPWLLPVVCLVALGFLAWLYRGVRQDEKEIAAHLRHLSVWERAVDHAHHRNPRPRRWPEP